MRENLISLGINLLAAIFFAFGVYYYQRYRCWKALYRKFHNRLFDICYQRDLTTIIREARVTVDGNKVKYEGVQLVEGQNTVQGPFTGEFIMNDFNLTIGSGLHYHTNWDGFNFPKIMIRDDKFYVQTDYVDKDYKLYHQVFVWELRKQ